MTRSIKKLDDDDDDDDDPTNQAFIQPLAVQGKQQTVGFTWRECRARDFDRRRYRLIRSSSDVCEIKFTYLLTYLMY